MRLRIFLVICGLTIALGSISSLAQSKPAQSNAPAHTVALTIDDLPFVTADSTRPTQPVDAKAAATANHKLLMDLAKHHVPVTGFVIQKGAEDLGLESGTKILREWTDRGFDLGNHSYAHPDFNDLTVEQFEDQVVHGEAVIAPLMQAAHRKLEFFRFPMNHTGDTKEKHDALAAFLTQRGYRTAPCTIETEDWMFNAKYFLMRSHHDDAAAARLRADYLAFTAAQIDYFTILDSQVLGYDAPQIMLIHDNQLNADVIEDLLALFDKRQYRFITLEQAESDPVYQAPETAITSYGPMWAYRWAKERNIKVDGSKEPEPPKWITDYGQGEPAKPRRPRAKL
jgi:peptidoglycan/xylan/chitin deacetylase (PgdA/CDA1 family)